MSHERDLGTPPELLHVALLGFIKRLLPDTRSRVFETNTASGLAMHSIVDLYKEYDGHRVRGEQLVRYTGSLVGKDFRSVVQVMPLALLWLETTGYGVPSAVLALWATVAELTREDPETTDATAPASARPNLKDHILLHIKFLLERWGS
ncbi:hypothetical protein RI367_005225 [Sorochytrium milnesiophthora]